MCVPSFALMQHSPWKNQSRFLLEGSTMTASRECQLASLMAFQPVMGWGSYFAIFVFAEGLIHQHGYESVKMVKAQQAVPCVCDHGRARAARLSSLGGRRYQQHASLRTRTLEPTSADVALGTDWRAALEADEGQCATHDHGTTLSGRRKLRTSLRCASKLVLSQRRMTSP